eukprot:3227082-Amphidinium_carterae.1
MHHQNERCPRNRPANKPPARTLQIGVPVSLCGLVKSSVAPLGPTAAVKGDGTSHADNHAMDCPNKNEGLKAAFTMQLQPRWCKAKEVKPYKFHTFSVCIPRFSM